MICFLRDSWKVPAKTPHHFNHTLLNSAACPSPPCRIRALCSLTATATPQTPDVHYPLILHRPEVGGFPSRAGVCNVGDGVQLDLNLEPKQEDVAPVLLQ